MCLEAEVLGENPRLQAGDRHTISHKSTVDLTRIAAVRVIALSTAHLGLKFLVGRLGTQLSLKIKRFLLYFWSQCQSVMDM